MAARAPEKQVGNLKIPLLFPVIREFEAETGSTTTASATNIINGFWLLGLGSPTNCQWFCQRLA
jgi:hypothetical protein